MNTNLKGTGVSKGIAIGKAYVYSRSLIVAQAKITGKKAKDKEIQRFKYAVAESIAQLHEIKNKISFELHAEYSAFVDTHLLMLDDPTFNKEVIALIKKYSCNAEWALQIQSNKLIAVFEEMDDPYLKSRKDDIEQITNRIQQCLNSDSSDKNTPETLKGRIIIADDLAPADTLMMQHQKIAGFITEFGGPLSHTAILARNLGIPAIVGVPNIRQHISTNDQLIIDGSLGSIFCDADTATLKKYRKLDRQEKIRKELLSEIKNKASATLDNRKIEITGNIDRPEDIRQLKKVANTGIGLYRTESLYMEKNEWPDEETQYKVYKRALFRLDKKSLVIRTVDLGADKEIQDTEAHGPMAHNPALGLRGIRRCLKEPRLFLQQLRAILRVSAYGDVQMMIPMLTNIEECQQVLELIEHAKQELRQRNLDFNENIPVGAMIEVPAAALSAQAFAKQLDFLSLGTNDLIQYTLALDRIDEEVNYLYNPLNPSVLNLIDLTIRAGKEAKIPVSLCGEMASDTRYTKLLLGMGLNSFSVHPNALLEVKNIVLNSKYSNLRPKVKKILQCQSTVEIETRIERLNKH